MKLNHLNKTLNFSTFNTQVEAKKYFENQKTNQKLFLTETCGDNNSVVKCMHSLSGEIEFCLGFSSETEVNKLNLITKYELDRWIVQVDNLLFFIKPSENKIITTVEIHTSLVGLYSKGGRILALEEAGLKILDFDGIVLQEENIDLIDAFELKNSILNISTVDGEYKEINLMI